MTRIILENEDGVTMYEADQFILSAVVKTIDGNGTEAIVDYDVDDDTFDALVNCLEEDFYNEDTDE